MNWQNMPESKNSCALSFSGNYVISHRPQCFTCSYHPPGKHVHVAQCPTLKEAKAAAKKHFLAQAAP